MTSPGPSGPARWAALAALALAGLLAAGGAVAAPPPVAAQAYVVEAADGTVLAERLADDHRAIASITKLMTVLVALEHLSLADVVTVPSEAVVGGATLSLRPGERVSVRDLVVGALVPSANDAATTLAYHAGDGSIARFVALMNAKAKALGLRSTRFANPHGLDQAGHYSSARDTVRLLRAALRVPVVRRWARARTAVAAGRRVESTDVLLTRLPELVAAKTGHTDDAGWSQVALARRGGVGIVASVLGSPSEEQRDSDLESLLRWGLAQYRTVKAVDSRRAYARVEVGWGTEPVTLVPARTVRRVLRVDRPLVERVVAAGTAALPVRKGQRLGEVRVFEGGRRIATVPLVAARAVAEPGLADTTWWTTRRAVHHLFGFVS
jgi:D-alanyl-D-alanine carboxypeptidase (penicillin-binding protein 5/6)